MLRFFFGDNHIIPANGDNYSINPVGWGANFLTTLSFKGSYNHLDLGVEIDVLILFTLLEELEEISGFFEFFKIEQPS